MLYISSYYIGEKKLETIFYKIDINI
uniref:Uncharacterized protein n=1 Tax=Anguilla anguilla TaxID=7936 RepID=A0A0E9VQK6_ANGAN